MDEHEIHAEEKASGFMLIQGDFHTLATRLAWWALAASCAHVLSGMIRKMSEGKTSPAMATIRGHVLKPKLLREDFGMGGAAMADADEKGVYQE